ncbi:hypothetical protein MCOR27_010850 [Pyricularia oryzae]|nr:hypothetical protein MCOR19_004407 [Pyricularia oryzae]KAI6266842.1 hypothetical protein MCOR27_010850 [Pyricularia oryzae]KAI6330888.1 hypothetical protein MCOR30_005013 [Pyricularia oryzae]KAI6461978.1 hypothetical protein MCOR15_004830 [Pyricularia oryzae]KAI6490516.1 hypothetical protein MCOR18_002337 [Pyricularia oryzae]
MASVSALAPGLRAVTRRTVRIPSSFAKSLGPQRTFSSLPTLRPTTCPRASPVFRSPSSSLLSASIMQPTMPTTAGEAALDLVPKTSITGNPAALGQIRCGPRPTTARTSRLKRARKHGFLVKTRTAKGRKMLARRQAKGRKTLTC